MHRQLSLARFSLLRAPPCLCTALAAAPAVSHCATNQLVRPNLYKLQSYQTRRTQHTTSNSSHSSTTDSAAAPLPSESSRTPLHVKPVTSGFGPRRVTPSRVPVSKRFAKQQQQQQGATPTSSLTDSQSQGSHHSTHTHHRQQRHHGVPVSAVKHDHTSTTAASPAHASLSSTRTTAASLTTPTNSDTGVSSQPLAQKLTPLQVAASFPYARNLSSQQPPNVIPTSPFIHTRWFLSKQSDTNAEQPGAKKERYEVYIAEAAQLLELLQYVDRTDTIALDTEFLSGGFYRPRLEVIQIGTPEILAAVDVQLLRHRDEFKKLIDQLMTKEWIVHGHRGDLEVMYELAKDLGLPALTPRSVFDTQIAFAFLHTKGTVSYLLLLQELLGISIDKSATLSDWSARPLTIKQIEYAIGDVKYLFEAKERLETALKESTATRSALIVQSMKDGDHPMQPIDADSSVGVRHAWFREEMSLLVNPRLYAMVDPEESFNASFHIRRMESGSRELALLQALYAWRERTAQMLNVAAPRILNNDALSTIAVNAPATVAELHAVQGIKLRTIQDHGLAILRVVKDVMELQPNQYPTLPTHLRSSSRTNWSLLSLCRAVVDTVSRRINISAFILAPRRDLMELSAASQHALDSASQWRWQGVGALDGTQSETEGSSNGGVEGFRASPLPSAVNYRFIQSMTEEMMHDRLTEQDLATSNGEGETDATATATATADQARLAIGDAAKSTLTHNGKVTLEEELEALSFSKLLRGWRRALIGHDLLSVANGQPIRWRRNNTNTNTNTRSDISKQTQPDKQGEGETSKEARVSELESETNEGEIELLNDSNEGSHAS